MNAISGVVISVEGVRGRGGKSMLCCEAKVRMRRNGNEVSQNDIPGAMAIAMVSLPT